MGRASGVDLAVSSCFADVIGKIEFPKPSRGKEVHVSYPFELRPVPPECKML